VACVSVADHVAVATQPSGTITLLFSDIEGSTRLLDGLGTEGYAEVLEQHRRLLRDVFARHEGYEVDTEGDAFFVAFARANDAVSAAEEGQRALIAAMDHAWTTRASPSMSCADTPPARGVRPFT
jgi:class 3 adenylate cyclase